MTFPTRDDLIDFVYAEARLLDETRLDDWLALFSEDAYYWMPLERGQSDPHLVTSLMYEDMFLLRLRVERLRGDRTYSQHPKTYGHHLLARPAVDVADHAKGEFMVTTAFHYVETQLDQQQLYAGWTRHELSLHEDQLKIRLKRVDLVNCEAAFGNIQLFM
jgi:3-phenylpropionate/cinnamic acid dioxygenase small subunit